MKIEWKFIKILTYPLTSVYLHLYENFDLSNLSTELGTSRANVGFFFSKKKSRKCMQNRANAGSFQVETRKRAAPFVNT